MRKILGIITGVALSMTVASPQAQAQTYPNGPINIVVGFPPGGTDDTGARRIAPMLEELLKSPVVVDSRPGAGMQIALEQTWAQPHDGQTVMWMNQQYLSAIEAVDKEIPYRTDQWVWLEMLQNDPVVIVVNAKSPWNSLDAFVEDMRARPDEITVGLLVGSVQVLACKRLLEGILDVKFREVPQTSGAAMRTAVVGGHLDATCTNASETYALGKEVRTLAVFNDAGTPLLPEAQTVNSYLKEKGKTEVIPDLGSVRGLAVPKDFVEKNPEAFKKLYDAYKTAVNSAEYKEWLKTTGRDTITLSKSLEETEKLVADYHQFFVENAEYLTGQ
jgi:tripartite-type tricarboxylate transporter receptor subunit TctC